MTTETISIEVDPETAREFAAVDETERKQLQRVLAIELRGLLRRPKRTLEQIMDDMSAEAASRGLTPEILESLLKADDDG